MSTVLDNIFQVHLTCTITIQDLDFQNQLQQSISP